MIFPGTNSQILCFSILFTMFANTMCMSLVFSITHVYLNPYLMYSQTIRQRQRESLNLFVFSAAMKVWTTFWKIKWSVFYILCGQNIMDCFILCNMQSVSKPIFIPKLITKQTRQSNARTAAVKAAAQLLSCLAGIVSQTTLPRMIKKEPRGLLLLENKSLVQTEPTVGLSVCGITKLY